MEMIRLTDTKATPVQEANKVRPQAFEALVGLLATQYDGIGQTGNSTVVVPVGISADGETMYMELSATIKNHKTRTTKSKTILAFDFDKETADYKSKVEEAKAKAEEKAKKKAEKIAKDKARREAEANGSADSDSGSDDSESGSDEPADETAE